jgi:hypothetical protein
MGPTKLGVLHGDLVVLSCDIEPKIKEQRKKTPLNDIK